MKIIFGAAVKDPTQMDLKQVNYWLRVFQAWLDQGV